MSDSGGLYAIAAQADEAAEKVLPGTLYARNTLLLIAKLARQVADELRNMEMERP